jgi:hypothetical protein
MSEEQSIKLKASAMVFSRLMTAHQQLKESERDLTRAADEDDFWGGAENAYEAAKRRYDAWSYIMKLVEQSI